MTWAGWGEGLQGPAGRRVDTDGRKSSQEREEIDRKRNYKIKESVTLKNSVKGIFEVK